MLALVDDDASVRQAMGRLIRSFGFTVMVFASAEEFLRFGSLQDTSCLVLDMHMPGMSGLQLQSHLVAEGYRIPIIFITADPDERSRSGSAGVREWLSPG
jgi:FixJ family two-component response regulator